MRAPDLFAYLNNAIQLAHIMAEAQSVIGMRLMGMAGLWSVPASEDRNMILKKIQAMVRAGTDVTALKPYRQKTRANAKRLGKRGLKRS